MNFLIVFSIYASLLGLLGGEFIEDPLIFKSDESKTQSGEAVFNKISFSQSNGLDIWKMEQSHFGVDAEHEKWDQIQITVNTNTRPFTATYHQLKDGHEIEYSANCLRCHSGGPRLIRPANDQKLSLKQKLQLEFWNSKIKSYGVVSTKENQLINARKIKLNIPLGFKEIQSEACTSCHRKGGVRSPLNSFQRGSILFMVKNKEMPPWPYQLSQQEKTQLMKDLYGN